MTVRLIDADALIENIKGWYCKDCDNSNYVRCRACGTDDAINAIDEAPTVGGWISVKDRVPEDGETVLVYIERAAWGDDGYAKRKKEIAIGWQIDGRWHVDGCMRVKGLYWMPLPGPPEEVSGDGD